MRYVWMHSFLWEMIQCVSCQCRFNPSPFLSIPEVFFFYPRDREKLLAAPRFWWNPNKWEVKQKKTPIWNVGPKKNIWLVWCFFVGLIFFLVVRCQTKRNQRKTSTLTVRDLVLNLGPKELPRRFDFKRAFFDRKNYGKICVSWIIMVCQLWLK